MEGMIKKKCPNPHNRTSCSGSFWVYPQNFKLKNLCNKCQKHKVNLYHYEYNKEWRAKTGYIAPDRRAAREKRLLAEQAGGGNESLS